MQFAAHGSYKIEKSGNIILIDAQGPFNDIALEQYQREFEALITQVSDKPWASLLSINGGGMFTPEAEQGLASTTQYRVENGMVAIAIVITNSPQADMLQMQLQRIYQSCNITFNFFSDINSAKHWLNTLVN